MKSYIVIGLGRFGSEAARRLCELGCEVLAMDTRSDLAQQPKQFHLSFLDFSLKQNLRHYSLLLAQDTPY